VLYGAVQYFKEWLEASWAFLLLAGVDEDRMHLKVGVDYS
jgi:hypothetical protein